MVKSKLTLLIFISLILGILVGHFFPGYAIKCEPLATMFMHAIKMIIAPLVFSSLVVGIAGHGNFNGLGRIGFKTILYFEIATTIALVIGLVVANVLKPGAGIHIDFPTGLHVAEQMKNLQAGTAVVSSHADAFVNMIPTSVIKSMADGNILQIVVFSVIFSIAIIGIGEKSKPVMDVLTSISEIMFKFTEYVMVFAPVGVFAAIASTIGHNGIGSVLVYAKLIGALYLALAIFVVFVLLVVCSIIKVPFFGMINALQEPAMLAFSTASSEAALPRAMEIMEKFGVPKNIVSFVMPTGYTFNLDGSTLYLALATIFISQITHHPLSIMQQVILLVTLMAASKGVAAVPRVSLVVLTATLPQFGLNPMAVAFLLGIDQILDMGRTTVNLIGNCVAAAVVARWENCFEYKKMYKFIEESKNANQNKMKISIQENKKHAPQNDEESHVYEVAD
ncbi:MAG: cation:dicarboxylase symporter family transporter [bacterium]